MIVFEHPDSPQETNLLGGPKIKLEKTFAEGGNADGCDRGSREMHRMWNL